MYKIKIYTYFFFKIFFFQMMTPNEASLIVPNIKDELDIKIEPIELQNAPNFQVSLFYTQNLFRV